MILLRKLFPRSAAKIFSILCLYFIENFDSIMQTIDYKSAPNIYFKVFDLRRVVLILNCEIV